MRNSILTLLFANITLAATLPAHGYVMVRSGFGELKQDSINVRQECGRIPSWICGVGPGFLDQGESLVFENASIVVRNPGDCTSGGFNYKGHCNLSVALGRRFNVSNTGALGIEIEILGAYAHYNKSRHLIDSIVPYAHANLAPHNADMDHIHVPVPDFIAVQYRNTSDIRIANMIPMYLKNQRIAGAQINAYWEQYILDWLSVGIGGGIGGAYVCTKFTTLEQCFILDPVLAEIDGVPQGQILWKYGGPVKQGRKYVHSGALLYNFMCFVRAEKFETLFEVGYRHIGLRQIFGGRMYGCDVKKLANMHSDQIYFGIGRTF